MKKNENLKHLTQADEIQRLQSENIRFKEELAETTRRNKELSERLEACNKKYSSAQAEHENGQALRLAELIIDNSPAILFRRRAAKEHEQRKMVYVSPNISRFGYKAEDFLTGKMMFRDIVYPEDDVRLTKEIDSYVKHKTEAYSQTYRIVTSTGEIRWIEDQTSVIQDEVTGDRSQR